MILFVKRIRDNKLDLPKREHPSDAGIDLRADLSDASKLNRGGYCHNGELIISPDTEAWIPCGFAFEIPDGFEGQVRGRSGLAVKKLKCGHLGTIDSAYRGEVAVCLRNEGGRDFVVQHGMRIAQMVISAIPPRLEVEESAELSSTDRGEGGFGSSGVL